jgi:hypothetical protein
MNFKNVLIGSFVGFLAYFLTGWLFYGILFPQLHPASAESSMLNVALGCFFAGMLLAYIFDQMGGVSDMMKGFQVGAIFSIISALSMLFFMYSSMPMNTTNFAQELIASVISGGIAGGLIAFVNGKMSK